MVKPFEEAAYKMKVGDISGPVRTRFGFHIIKVVDKREERKKEFSEVREQIEQSLKNKKFFQERRMLLEELQAEAKVDKLLPERAVSADGHGDGEHGGNDHPHGAGGDDAHPVAAKPAIPTDAPAVPAAKPVAPAGE